MSSLCFSIFPGSPRFFCFSFGYFDARRHFIYRYIYIWLREEIREQKSRCAVHVSHLARVSAHASAMRPVSGEAVGVVEVDPEPTLQ
jgi:hypothetical protein